MFAVRIRNFQFGMMLATALLVSLWPAAGRAYTDDQQQACMGDAFRVCGAEIPDIERVRLCMSRNKAQLSPGCRAQFRSGPEAVASGAAERPLGFRAKARKYRRSARSRED
ncbi:MAG: hypothetical protein QOF07_688 [Bradyrhizobium sp.]|jgi:hypothetical protein|nr:hypothetical protein [Bradyrhizobium sp.]